MDKTSFTFFKPTDDDWHGSYEFANLDKRYPSNRLVRITYCGNTNGYDTNLKPLYRLVAFGNDDFGLEFDSESLGEVESKLKEILLMEVVNIEPLKNLGFIIF